jgi:hypothetical protein
MPNVEKVRPRSIQEIEDAATGLLRRFQPEVLRVVSGFDVETFFELHLEDDTDIEPIYTSLDPRVDGYTDSAEKKCFIAQRLADHHGRLEVERRFRSTLAHEIGHCYLHVPDAQVNRQYQQLFRDDGTYATHGCAPGEIKCYEHPEWQAWRFASALLMPEITFRRAVECNWTKRQIQNAFGVNPSYLELRMRELKISKQLRRG